MREALVMSTELCKPIEAVVGEFPGLWPSVHEPSANGNELTWAVGRSLLIVFEV